MRNVLDAVPVLLASVVFLVLVPPAWTHPQCLDFEPPFRPRWHLEFCTQYEDFGCCDQDTDNAIAERYWDIIDQLEAVGAELCQDLLKEVMCQVSSSPGCSCAAGNLQDNPGSWLCRPRVIHKLLFIYLSSYLLHAAGVCPAHMATDTIHSFTLSFTPRDNPESLIDLSACFGTVAGNWRKSTHTC